MTDTNTTPDSTPVVVTPTDLGAPVQPDAPTSPAHLAEPISSTPTDDPSTSTDLVDVPGVGDVDLVTAAKSAPPKLVQAADGTWHLVLTWTKATKAHVGTTVAGVTGLAELATTYVLPADSPYTHWAQVAVGVVGLVGTWLGVYLPTNAAKKSS